MGFPGRGEETGEGGVEENVISYEYRFAHTHTYAHI